jgi:hypothetical protein
MLQLRYARKWLEKPQVRAAAPPADESEDAEEELLADRGLSVDDVGRDKSGAAV